jgi:hypothetical protein
MKKKLVVLLVIILAIIILIFLTLKYVNEISAISKLQLTIKGIQIQELKATYTKLKLDIEITNPTNEGISQLSTYYNIFIADTIVGEGSIPITYIFAQSTKETSTTFIIYYANVTNAVIDAITNKNFNLTIDGILHAKVLFSIVRISHEFSASYSYS